jgi:hypothetical protein
VGATSPVPGIPGKGQGLPHPLGDLGVYFLTRGALQSAQGTYSLSGILQLDHRNEEWETQPVVD